MKPFFNTGRKAATVSAATIAGGSQELRPGVVPVIASVPRSGACLLLAFDFRVAVFIVSWDHSTILTTLFQEVAETDQFDFIGSNGFLDLAAGQYLDFFFSLPVPRVHLFKKRITIAWVNHELAGAWPHMAQNILKGATGIPGIIKGDPVEAIDPAIIP